MRIGIPKETFPGERRVAMNPMGIPALVKKGFEIIIEAGAGYESGYPDSEYTEKGAKISDSREEIFSADIIFQVRGLGSNQEAGKSDTDLYREGQIIISSMDPYLSHDETRIVAEKKVTAFALELVPRISRAQSMDILSSMASVAGYKAVLIAADHLNKMFPLSMTAAGTLKPAKVFVMGAGVAGLQAIATAKRLGAVVEAYDIRTEVKDQIESLGAKFLVIDLGATDSQDKGGYAKELTPEMIKKQQDLMKETLAEMDVVITTAAIPGRKSPVLLTEVMLRAMKPASMMIDIAAERGGNCALTKAGEIVNENGIMIHGPLNIASDIPYHASQMYAKNASNFLLNMLKDGEVKVDTDDEIVAGSLVTQGGEIVNPAIRKVMGLEALPEPEPEQKEEAGENQDENKNEQNSENNSENNNG
jgi:NAD(P) transhydrogenase subunit alpha